MTWINGFIIDYYDYVRTEIESRHSYIMRIFHISSTIWYVGVSAEQSINFHSFIVFHAGLTYKYASCMSIYSHLYWEELLCNVWNNKCLIIWLILIKWPYIYLIFIDKAWLG